jgi:hypothetical protein
VEQVLAHVPQADRCQCPPAPGIMSSIRKLFGLG